MIPRKLKIKNFLSHDSSFIDFDKFDVALVLGVYNGSMDESNGAGKSSILEAIRWALFDKSRHKKKDGVVKHNCSECRVVFDFEVCGDLYQIIRKRNKVLNQSEVLFSRWSDDGWESIVCDTNTATDAKILSVINFNHDVFINSVYFKQGDISIFTDSTPGKRKDILKSLLKLEKWDAYQKEAKSHCTKITSQINEKLNNASSIDEINETIDEYENRICELKEEINNGDNEYGQLNNKLFSLKSDFQMVENDESGRKELLLLQQNYKEYQKNICRLEQNISCNEMLIEEKKSEIKKAKDKVSLFNRQIKEKAGLDVEKKRKNLLAGQAREKLRRSELAELKKEVNLDEDCEMCLRPIKSKSEAENIKAARANKVKETQAKLTKITQMVRKLKEEISEYEVIIKRGEQAELARSKLRVKVSGLQSEIERDTEANQQFGKELRRIKALDYQKRIEDLSKRFDEDKADKLRAEISRVEKSLSSLKSKINELNVELGIKVSDIGNLRKKLEEQTKIHKDIKDLRAQLFVYEKLSHYFGKDGIQSIIIENVVGELVDYTNEILDKICNEPTNIEINMQRQTDSGSWNETFDIVIKSGSRKDEIDAFSGGEKFRISLALRLALSKILSERMGGVVKFLLLDEVSSSLDAKGLSMFADIVKYLGNDMKILIITHDDKLKDKFDDVIVVEKTAAGSVASN